MMIKHLYLVQSGDEPLKSHGGDKIFNIQVEKIVQKIFIMQM